MADEIKWATAVVEAREAGFKAGVESAPYWMIEHGYDQRDRWLRAAFTGSVNGVQRAELLWCRDPQAALHFAREQDARGFALLHPEWCVLAKITEHMDVSSSVDSAGVPVAPATPEGEQHG